MHEEHEQDNKGKEVEAEETVSLTDVRDAITDAYRAEKKARETLDIFHKMKAKTAYSEIENQEPSKGEQEAPDDISEIQYAAMSKNDQKMKATADKKATEDALAARATKAGKEVSVDNVAQNKKTKATAERKDEYETMYKEIEEQEKEKDEKKERCVDQFYCRKMRPDTKADCMNGNSKCDGMCESLRDSCPQTCGMCNLPTGAAPAAPTVSGVAATVSDEDGEWIPVAKISDQNNVHRTTTAISGIKLSDAEITSLLKAGDGKLWLKCGNCNSYMQTSGEWCSDCKQSDGKHADQCALSPKGPFSNKGYNNCHAGSDCWKMSGSGAIYNDCGTNGCACNSGGGRSGMLYVHGR